MIESSRSSRILKTGAGQRRSRFSFLKPLVFFATYAGLAAGCTLFATRPVQEMSDTTAALRAAREVQADTLTPELYRQANEWFIKAKHEYKFKNFSLAKQYAEKARYFAEQAEFEATRNGGSRDQEMGASDPMMTAPPPPPPPAEPPPVFPGPNATPMESYQAPAASPSSVPMAVPGASPQGGPMGTP